MKKGKERKRWRERDGEISRMENSVNRKIRENQTNQNECERPGERIGRPNQYLLIFARHRSFAFDLK